LLFLEKQEDENIITEKKKEEKRKFLKEILLFKKIQKTKNSKIILNKNPTNVENINARIEHENMKLNIIKIIEKIHTTMII
jgi:hypothetical protein